MHRPRPPSLRCDRMEFRAINRGMPVVIFRTVPLLLLAASSACFLSACRGTPIELEGERSQFDRHDALQGDYSAPYREDEFGKRVPNLRARLLRR